MNDNSKLAVAALQNGTVIDHIPSHLVFKVVPRQQETRQKRHLESVGRDFS